MKLIKGIISFTLCISIVLSFPVESNAAVFLTPNGDNVDSGGHLDWDYDTKYYAECVNAQDTWNNYKSGVIREDSISIIEDIFVTDYYSATDGTLGYRSQGDSLIAFNDYYFVSGNKQSLTNLQRKKTALHEFGHALGLGENNSGVAAVMRQGIFSYTSLHQDDKESYDKAATYY